MVRDGKGGAKTLTGLNFEEKVDFIDLLKDIKGYTVKKSGKKLDWRYILMRNLSPEHLKNIIIIGF